MTHDYRPPRARLHPNGMWERHYACEWMGTPPDIAACQRLHSVMTTPPEYQRREWTRARYAKL